MNLITSNQVKEYSSISESLEDKLIDAYIPVAERFYLKPLLGSDLIDTLKGMIQDDELDDLHKTLYNHYIVPCLTYYVIYEASTFNYIRTENKGLTIKFSENSEAVSTEQFKLYKQSLYDKAVMYANDMQEFVNKHKDEFGFEDDNYTSNQSNSSGLFLGF